MAPLGFGLIKIQAQLDQHSGTLQIANGFRLGIGASIALQGVYNINSYQWVVRIGKVCGRYVRIYPCLYIKIQPKHGSDKKL